MCVFVIFENLFDWLFTKIYLVYWYVWYSFDYYLVLTSFTSCLFTYFKIDHQHQTFIKQIFFHSSQILKDFLKFQQSRLFWPPRLISLTKISDQPPLPPINLSLLPFIRHLRVFYVLSLFLKRDGWKYSLKEVWCSLK